MKPGLSSAWCGVGTRLAFVLAGALATSCDHPPRGATARIFIDTDAPVPGGGADDPPALFDRVRIEAFLPGASEPCEGCTRIVALDRDVLAGEGLSFGIGVPAGEVGTRIRARAYRGTAFPSGEPPVRSSLDVVIALPSMEEDDARDFTLFLPTKETGDPASSLASPREPRPGHVPGTRAGTWGPAQRTLCTGTPWPGQVCVPGGAFWLTGVFGTTIGLSPYEEQLVVLPPYFIDRTETTIGDVLGSGLLDDPDALTSWSGDEEGPELAAFLDWCTFSGNQQRLDLPVNCMNIQWARDYCIARGAELPSEAQVDYLIGGLESRAFPWGSEAECSDAALALQQFSIGHGVATVAELECGQQGDFGAFRPVGTSARDRVEVPDGSVEDIASNASELTRDAYTTMDAPCWGTGWVYDPVCTSDDPDADLVIRGGAISAPLALASSIRGAAPLDESVVDGTFRCARNGDDTTDPPAELDIVLGQGCRDDADCGTSDGARCITTHDVSWPGGGIVGGYCSRSCGVGGDCGPEGQCVQGECLLRCDAFKPVLTHIDDLLPPNKCHGRRDLACHEVKVGLQGYEVCLGACSSDAQCEPGDHCDRKVGGCRAGASHGLADGLPCNSDPDCAGFCVGDPGKAFCASGCSAGGEIDSEDCGGSANALCYESGDYNAVGSLGFCYLGCKAHSDCYPPTNFCEPVLTEPGYVETPWWNVADAVCREASTCTGVGSACGNGLVCTATVDGNYCLSPSMPF